MAPPRRKQGEEAQVVTSTQLGSDNPEPTSYPLAKPGEYPEGYEDQSPAWKKAYDHAAGRGNTAKSCINFADSHEADSGD